MPDSAGSRFAETTGDLFLYQHVDFPTRFREGYSPSQLDLVFSNDELMVDELASSSPIRKSDHVVLTWHYNYKHTGSHRHTADKHYSNNSLNYKRGDYTAMTLALSKICWTVMEHVEIEESWKFILSEINEKVRKHIPVLRHRKWNHNMSWWLNKLKKCQRNTKCGMCIQIVSHVITCHVQAAEEQNNRQDKKSKMQL